MAEPAVIQGIESEENRKDCHVQHHPWSRTRHRRREAAGIVDRKTGEVRRPGKITREMMIAQIAEAGVELRGAGPDESPLCYKRLEQVLEAHSSTVRILHTLHSGRGSDSRSQ